MFKPTAIDHIPGFLRGVLFTSAVVFLPIFLAAQETDSQRQVGTGGIDSMLSKQTPELKRR